MRTPRLTQALFWLLFTSVALVPARVYGGQPTDLVKQTIEQARDIFSSPGLSREEKIRRLRKIAEERFDFEEMARRSLATHWKELTPAQQKEFVALFSNLLEDTYAGKVRRYEKEIKEHMSDNVIYLGERIDGPLAKVSTEILTSGGVAVPVDYSFIRKQGKWLVYDVTVERVSVVRNYRSQFAEILRTGSFADLLDRLRQKSAK